MEFVDLHSHVLPGIDDGAKDLKESLAMLKLAQSSGTQRIVATPHMMPGTYDNQWRDIMLIATKLRHHLLRNGLTIQLEVAAEVRACPELIHWQQQGALPLFGSYQGKSLLLLELPSTHIPRQLWNLLQWLLEQQVVPILAHPERNRGVWAAPQWVEQWKARGGLVQVTAGSFLGGFRSPAQELAEYYLKRQLIDAIASDCHNLQRRSPDLRAAHQRVQELSGSLTADYLFYHHPLALLSGAR